MKANGYGKIVNVSSLGAISPPSPHPHYHAAKAGVLGLTYDMAAELGPHNIYVNAIMPGPIRTPFFDEIVDGEDRRRGRAPSSHGWATRRLWAAWASPRTSPRPRSSWPRTCPRS